MKKEARESEMLLNAEHKKAAKAMETFKNEQVSHRREVSWNFASRKDK